MLSGQPQLFFPKQKKGVVIFAFRLTIQLDKFWAFITHTRKHYLDKHFMRTAFSASNPGLPSKANFI
jgi:hypothetical protein